MNRGIVRMTVVVTIALLDEDSCTGKAHSSVVWHLNINLLEARPGGELWMALQRRGYDLLQSSDTIMQPTKKHNENKPH